MAHIYTPFMKKVLNITERKRKSNIHHYCKSDDFRAGFKVAEWRRFCHPAWYKVALTALSKLPLTVLRPALSRAVRLDTANPARAWRAAAGPRQRHRGRGRLSRRSWPGCDNKPGLPASRNVWSLHGLHGCMTRRGDTIETAHIKLQLDKAVARSGVPVRASCYCRHS